jgi:hypothetical protein
MNAVAEVLVEGETRYVNRMSAGAHVLTFDEGQAHGGTDAGPRGASQPAFNRDNPDQS